MNQSGQLLLLLRVQVNHARETVVDAGDHLRLDVDGISEGGCGHDGKTLRGIGVPLIDLCTYMRSFCGLSNKVRILQ